MCTVLQFVSILGVIFLQDWITWYKTITVGCHKIKLFHTFFAACQNQAVITLPPTPYGPFLIFSKTWRQEDMEVKTFYIPFG
jgi:hypothetical protein